eukprot:1179901-Prorocentrum_minimum.AAC.2
MGMMRRSSANMSCAWEMSCKWRYRSGFSRPETLDGGANTKEKNLIWPQMGPGEGSEGGVAPLRV